MHAKITANTGASCKNDLTDRAKKLPTHNRGITVRSDAETDRWTEKDGESNRDRKKKSGESGTLTRVCLYLRAFLSDASAAIDTLSLTQK